MACSEILGQVALSCLAVISLVFKRIIEEGEVKALTSMQNESSKLDTFINAASPIFLRGPFVVFMVIVAWLVLTS